MDGASLPAPPESLPALLGHTTQRPDLDDPAGGEGEEQTAGRVTRMLVTVVFSLPSRIIKVGMLRLCHFNISLFDLTSNQVDGALRSVTANGGHGGAGGLPGTALVRRRLLQTNGVGSGRNSPLRSAAAVSMTADFHHSDDDLAAHFTSMFTRSPSLEMPLDRQTHIKGVTGDVTGGIIAAGAWSASAVPDDPSLRAAFSSIAGLPALRSSSSFDSLNHIRAESGGGASSAQRELGGSFRGVISELYRQGQETSRCLKDDLGSDEDYVPCTGP